MAVTSEEISVSAKVSNKMWQVIATLSLVAGGAVGGVGMLGAKDSTPAAVAVDHTPELRANISAVASATAEAKRDGERTQAELKEVVRRFADAQEKQATAMIAISKSIANIEGQLSVTAPRRR